MHMRFIIILAVIGLFAGSVAAKNKERKAKKEEKKAAKVVKEAAPEAATSAATPKQETVRDWKDASGKTVVRGKFWCVGGGILQVRGEGAAEATRLKLSAMSLEDIQYIIRDRGGVLGPTCKLLRSGYGVSSDGRITQIPASQKRITGTVADIVDDTMALIKIGTKSYMVMCDTSKIRKGKKFEGYLKRQSESKIDLPNGQQGYLYRAYVALGDEKHLTAQLRANPRPFLDQITGSSAAHEVWLQTQRQLEKLEAHEKRLDELAVQKAQAKLERDKSKLDQSKQQNREKLAVKYQTEIDRYKTRLKEAEADIKRLEYRKKAVKAYSKTWTNARSRIRQLESEVLRIKKAIRELEDKLREVE